MKIRFCGAATGVTGSCHLVSTDKHKILLDCGMFQGGKSMEALNRQPFPFNPAEIECVVMSHAHIDHCGRLPLLVKHGFKGPVYATDATAQLMDVMLKDSAHIHEQDALWENKRGARAGKKPVEPLYTLSDAQEAINLIKPVRLDQLIELNDQMKIVFNEAGHILGSAIVELWTTEGDRTSKTVFSGDIGVNDRPILRDPKIIKKADYVIMETTYGSRLHETFAQGMPKLLEIAAKTAQRGGNVIIPAFAVGRTQELLFELNKVYDGKGPMHDILKNVPVYVDSPMAKNATDIFILNAQYYDDETRGYLLRGDHPLDFMGLHFTQTSAESQALNADRTPKIIISASGMCDAGRIRHHLKHNLWGPKNSIVFVGYQAEGTLGRRLVDGEKTVTLFGEDISVQAEIYNLQGFSGHADQNGLFNWLSGFQAPPKQIFLVHGEKESKETFAKLVEQKKGWKCTVVEGYDEYELAEDVSMTGTTAEQEFVSDEEIDGVRRRIADIHSALETVLYSTTISLHSDVTPDKMTEIKNSVANLEKDILEISAAVARE